MSTHVFLNFIKSEAKASFILLTAIFFALIISNSSARDYYTFIFHTPIHFSLSSYSFHIPSLLFVINDALMAVFFLYVSLEIKREFIEGELNTRDKALLPIAAALGGMILPALIYLAFTFNHPLYLPGWGIPVATDIAFSLGILMLIGSRAPLSLKVFLTALAIIDDLGAIIIITIFYTKNLSWLPIISALFIVLILLSLNYFNVDCFWPYGILGAILWVCILKSGVHATIAGVILALTIPLKKNKNQYTFFKIAEKKLHPWITYGILPLFIFANAGLSFSNIELFTLFNTLSLGILCGLFIGKPLGIISASWIAIKYGFARLPARVSWMQLNGVAIICGIGFTMSLFIGALAFSSAELIIRMQLGVFLGSLLSGITGYLLLRSSKISNSSRVLRVTSLK